MEWSTDNLVKLANLVASWVDPHEKEYPVLENHAEWVVANQTMLQDQYSLQFSKPLTPKESYEVLLQADWIRISPAGIEIWRKDYDVLKRVETYVFDHIRGISDPFYIDIIGPEKFYKEISIKEFEEYGLVESVLHRGLLGQFGSKKITAGWVRKAYVSDREWWDEIKDSGDKQMLMGALRAIRDPEVLYEILNSEKIFQNMRYSWFDALDILTEERPIDQNIVKRWLKTNPQDSYTAGKLFPLVTDENFLVEYALSHPGNTKIPLKNIKNQDSLKKIYTAWKGPRSLAVLRYITDKDFLTQLYKSPPTDIYGHVDYRTLDIIADSTTDAELLFSIAKSDKDQYVRETALRNALKSHILSQQQLVDCYFTETSKVNRRVILKGITDMDVLQLMMSKVTRKPLADELSIRFDKLVEKTRE